MRDVAQAVAAVLRNPALFSLFAGVSAAAFTFAVWLPNFSAIARVWSSASAGETLSFLLSLYGAIGTNFSLLSASYTIAASILFGLNVALFVRYVRIKREQTGGSVGVKDARAGVAGAVSGLFGIGCAACGTFILSSLFGLFGAAALVTALPLGGGEFGILAVALLSYSAYAISRKSAKAACEISDTP